MILFVFAIDNLRHVWNSDLYVAKGKVKVMARTFPLDDVADAIQRGQNNVPGPGYPNGNEHPYAVVTDSPLD